MCFIISKLDMYFFWICSKGKLNIKRREFLKERESGDTHIQHYSNAEGLLGIDP